MINSTGLAVYNTGGPNVTMTDSADVLEVCYNTTDVYVRCEGLANYVMGPFTGNPNTPAGQDYIFQISRSPTPSGNPSGMGLGAVGLAVNGVPLYNFLDGRSYNSSNNTNANNSVLAPITAEGTLICSDAVTPANRRMRAGSEDLVAASAKSSDERDASNRASVLA